MAGIVGAGGGAGKHCPVGSWPLGNTWERSYGAAVNAAAGKSPFTRTEIAFESTFLMLAYDIGGATIGLTSVESSNSGYVSGADTTKTLATMSMAF